MARGDYRRRVEQRDWSNWVIAIFFIITFAGSKVYDSFSYKETVATKPYVDGQFAEGKTYTDKAAAVTLERAIAHSDAGRQDVMLKLQEFAAESRASNAKIEGKVDSLFNLIQNRLAQPRGKGL